MTREDAEGMTSTRACLFWMISLTVTLRPFQSVVAFIMSSPTFLGERPRGPILGARDEVAATSPPTHRRQTGGTQYLINTLYTKLLTKECYSYRLKQISKIKHYGLIWSWLMQGVVSMQISHIFHYLQLIFFSQLNNLKIIYRFTFFTLGFFFFF